MIEAARGDQQRNKLFEYFTLAQADGTGPLATLLSSQRHQWRHRGGLIVITPSADRRWPGALLDLGIRGHRSPIASLRPPAVGVRRPCVGPSCPGRRPC